MANFFASPKIKLSIFLIGVLSLFILAFPSPTSILSQHEVELQEFESFLKSHNKHYSTEEYKMRYKIFRNNLGYIRVFNSKQSQMTLGLTYFADMTNEEFKAGLTSPIFMPKAAKSLKASPLTIPSSVNWVQQGVVGPVINQGQMGSVTDIVTANNVASVWCIAGHGLVALSYQELVDCVGVTPAFNDVYAFIVANGLTSAANYPTTGRIGTCNKAKVAQPVAKISAYVDVAPNSPTALEAAIALGPVTVAVEADQSAWQLYTGGIISNNCGTNVDHVVLAVGYSLTGTTPYYTVQNSWGTAWGMNGYANIAITNGPGTCGIQVMPIYPVV